jgi:16S rRNA (cytosine967-C5)-methyltransferase
MTPAARASAAIEVLADIEGRKRPAAEALKDWGLSHRFAGSDDRAAIGNLVFDALRTRASAAYAMGEDSPRALVLRTLASHWGLGPEGVSVLADGGRFAPAPLSPAELEGLRRELPADAPAHIRGDYPEWLAPEFERAFGAGAAEEGAALATRAPVDLRVNSLKTTREKVLHGLRRFEAVPTPYSPLGVRIAAGSGPSRSPHVEAEPGHGKGWYEVQDEGSQLATLLAGAHAKEQVLDLCAGAGGKTLALAAMMKNKGQIFATDDDKRRLAPIHDRLKRSGARNVQLRTPKSVGGEIADLAGQCDLVLIDAPCTGTGAWRRNPDAKWRMRPGALEQRQKEQVEILDRAVPLLKAGGRIVYITCSVLDEENGAQVRAFLARHAEFFVQPAADVANALGERAFMFRKAARLSGEGILMTPRTTETDGFFVSVLKSG